MENILKRGLERYGKKLFGVKRIGREEEVVKIGESFFTEAYQLYYQKTLEDREELEEIIKYLLPTDRDEAKKEWFEGIEIDGKKYYGWFATPSGMKAEEKATNKEKNNGRRCEAIFVRDRNFAKYVEKIVSLDTFKNDLDKEISLNKKVYSRLSLAFSSSIKCQELPNIIVLGQATTVLKGNYYSLEKKREKVKIIDKKGKEKEEEKTFYNLIDINLDSKTGKIDIFDGGGIATPKIFEDIKKHMKVNYDIEFAIIRNYGLGTKGLIHKFNIIEYLDAYYKEDTDFVKKEKGIYSLKDMWGDWKVVTPNTMLLNESMCKLAKNFKNFNEYLEKLNSCSKEEYNILNKLYVTKINKNENKLEQYKRINYQLINALMITEKELRELAKQDIKYFAKIIKPYICKNTKDKEEFELCIDYINHFFKNLANDDDIEEIDLETGEIYKIDEGKNISTKIDEMISIDRDFTKLRYSKKHLARLVEKKVRELAKGKITVKARYQYAAIDSIAYMNYAMYGDARVGNPILEADQFYSADCENGDIRVTQRCPMMSANEVHKIKFVRDEFKDRWYSKCKELIYTPEISDFGKTSSGMDKDGDSLLVINNKIIENSVVPIEKQFWNLSDGKTKEIKYDNDGIFASNYDPSSNLIGSIALKAAYINSEGFQGMRDYYLPESDEFYKKKELVNFIIKEEKIAKTKQEAEEIINKKIEEGKIIKYYNVEDKVIKKYFTRKFNDREFLKDIYTMLMVSQSAIDAPKTLDIPDLKVDLEDVLSRYKDERNVEFLYYDKDCIYSYNQKIDESENNKNRREELRQRYTYINSPLCNFARKIQKYLLNNIEANQKDFSNNAEIITNRLVNLNYNKAKILECIDELDKAFKEFNKEQQRLKRKKDTKIKDEKTRIRVQENEGKIKNTTAEYKRKEIVKEANEEYINAIKDLKEVAFAICDSIKNKYDLETIATAFTRVKFKSEEFIINFFFEIFSLVNDNLQNLREKLIEDENGEIEILYKKYRKENYKMKNNRKVINSLVNEDKLRYKLCTVAKIRGGKLKEDSSKIILDEINKNGYIDLQVKVKEDNTITLLLGDDELCYVFTDKAQLDTANSLYDCIHEEKIRVNNISFSKAGLDGKSFGLEVIEIV